MITNFDFKKKFGQNFISDKNLLNAIADDAGVDAQTQVLEIGAGAGTLTEVLADKAEKVVSIEIDKDLKPYLELVRAKHPNVEFIFGDFMRIDRAEIESHFDKTYAVVANLPYYITTPIIFRLLEENFNISSMTLMVQKEVAERFVANTSSKEYGAVSVMLQSMCDITVTRIVNRSMFFPQPKVDSAVVNLKINPSKYDIPNRDMFAKVVKSAFMWRRKTLNNCLQMGFDLEKAEVEKIIATAGLKNQVRGEKLSVDDYIKLSVAVESHLTEKD